MSRLVKEEGVGGDRWAFLGVGAGLAHRQCRD